MPKPTSKRDDDGIGPAFAAMQRVIASTEQSATANADELTRLVARVVDLERLCGELRAFAHVAHLPDRVIVALDNAAKGHPIGPSLLPITPDDLAESPAATFGRQGGLKGGHARAKSLSAKKRSDIAKKAAVARWKNTTK